MGEGVHIHLGWPGHTCQKGWQEAEHSAHLVEVVQQGRALVGEAGGGDDGFSKGLHSQLAGEGPGHTAGAVFLPDLCEYAR